MAGVMCDERTGSPTLNQMRNANRILIAGFLGCAMMLFVAYTQPTALNEFEFGDLSPPGLMAKLGALLAVGGLFGFFHGMPESFTEPKRNVLRLLYTAGFIAASFCSESDWQCFS